MWRSLSERRDMRQPSLFAPPADATVDTLTRCGTILRPEPGVVVKVIGSAADGWPVVQACDQAGALDKQATPERLPERWRRRAWWVSG